MDRDTDDIHRARNERAATPVEQGAPPTDTAELHRKLMISLFRELFQTEQSAEVHPRREARRLGNNAPAEALEAVSNHATQVLRKLPEVARSQQLPVSRAGMGLGQLFSRVREEITDRLIDAERSYRMTLLGLRHGVDLVKMIRHVADAAGRVEIAGFCTHWLEEREPLVERVEQQMTWFCHHPDAALAPGFTVSRFRRNGERSKAKGRPARGANGDRQAARPS
jgi:hypothetical protein